MNKSRVHLASFNLPILSCRAALCTKESWKACCVWREQVLLTQRSLWRHTASVVWRASGGWKLFNWHGASSALLFSQHEAPLARWHRKHSISFAQAAARKTNTENAGHGHSLPSTSHSRGYPLPSPLRLLSPLLIPSRHCKAHLFGFFFALLMATLV